MILEEGVEGYISCKLVQNQGRDLAYVLSHTGAGWMPPKCKEGKREQEELADNNPESGCHGH